MSDQAPAVAPIVTIRASMLNRSHRSAPKFDGDPRSLIRFLKEVRDLARENGIADKQAIAAAISYVDPLTDYELWGTLKTAAGDSWDAFQAEVVAFYPEADGDYKYIITNLEDLTTKASRMPMRDQVQFGEYYREFFVIARFLESKNRISERDVSTYFFKGLHQQFRAELHEYLSWNEHWPLDTLFKNALSLLANRSNGSSAITTPSTASVLGPTLSRDPMAVKTEVFDASSLRRYLESDLFVNTIVTRLNAVRVRDGPPQYQRRHNVNTYQGTASDNNVAAQSHHDVSTQRSLDLNHPNARSYENSPYPTSMPYAGCAFCSDQSHYIKDCRMLMDYIQRGLCHRDQNRQLALPNGQRISFSTAPGKDMRERVDNWHQANTAAARD